MEKIKLDKKSLLYLGIILIIVLLILVGLFFLFRKPKEKSLIDLLSVPGNQAHVSEEFIETLSAPSSPQKQPNLSEDLIKKLSVPAQ